MRNDIIRNLSTSLVLHHKVVTSRTKAKAVKREIDHYLAKVAKAPTLATRRHLFQFFYDKKAVAKIFDVMAPNLHGKVSGFVKAYQLPARRRDATDRTVLVLLPELFTVPKTATKPAKSAKTKKS